MWLWNLLKSILSQKNTPQATAPAPAVPAVPQPIPAPLQTPITKPTMNSKIYDFAKSCMGKDIAATQNELGCAEAVSYVLNHCLVSGFPKAGILGTAELNSWLKKNASIVTTPLPGDIIISPTGSSTKGAKHGHVGVVAKFGILSNNSMNGLFQETYTLDEWHEYYHNRLGFPVLFYSLD